MQTRWQHDKDRLLQPAPDKGLPIARPTSSLPGLHRVSFALFLIFLPATFWFRHLNHYDQWPIGVLLGLAFATTIVGQCRVLPLQNVIAATLFILVVSGIIQTVGTLTNLPFGPYVYTDDAGYCLFDTLPWLMPVLWVVVILNCRGVARLILRPWRASGTYGFRIIALTCVLGILFDLGLEPFATQACHFWVWQTATLPHAWYTMPWLNLLGWFITVLLCFAFAGVWLINKKPVQMPPDYHPLAIWLALNLFIAVTLLLYALWLPAILVLAGMFIIATLALSYAQG